MKRWLPLIITAVFAIWVASKARLPKEDPTDFALNEFGRLPAVANGRFQPLDSLARNSLLQLREKQTAMRWMTPEELKQRGFVSKLLDIRQERIPATDWIAMMMMKPEAADELPVIRIDHPDLIGLLALPSEKNEEKHLDGKSFSFAQISPKFADLDAEVRRAGAVKAELRSTYERAVVKLSNALGIYMKLQNTIRPQNAKDWGKELDAYLSHIGPGVAAAQAEQAKKDYDRAALDLLMNDLTRFDAMLRLEPPLAVPPHHPERDRDEWMRMGEALMEIARGAPPQFAIASYARISDAYRAGDVAAFKQAVADYGTALGAQFMPELKKAKNEQLFNALQPFYLAMVIFVVAGLCAIAFWFRPEAWDWLRRTAVWLVGLALVVLSIGLIFRMVLEGRPPVTNLYSSAVFIGWGACVLGLVLEAFWKNSIGVVISSVIGFVTLIIAHHLSFAGDTMEMMRAVLDTNLWLSTHVVVVTLGYASTFVAGALAIVYIIRGFVTTGLDTGTARSLGKMVYGIVCFATLFSFVGTVLGGIWADQSWGRFWGWDPKENGALIIVLWNALILHARWGGLVRERGLMLLAIGGNIVTAWSWFGVNMLGIGLHSYGFTESGFKWLILFASSQILLIALGSLPLSVWRSFRGDGPNDPPSAGTPQLA